MDETYIGGLEKNKHESKKLKTGRGTVGKTPVVGMKDRETGQVKAQVVDHTDTATLQGFVVDNTDVQATVYTDEAAAYRGMGRRHEAVKHSAKEYVRGMAHTNGIESEWAMLKRGHDGVYHHFSVKHLGRYVHEFTGRHNNRPLDTRDQMAGIGAEERRQAVAVRRLGWAKRDSLPAGAIGQMFTLPLTGESPYTPGGNLDDGSRIMGTPNFANRTFVDRG